MIVRNFISKFTHDIIMMHIKIKIMLCQYCLHGVSISACESYTNVRLCLLNSWIATNIKVPIVNPCNKHTYSYLTGRQKLQMNHGQRDGHGEKINNRL